MKAQRVAVYSIVTLDAHDTLLNLPFRYPFRPLEEFQRAVVIVAALPNILHRRQARLIRDGHSIFASSLTPSSHTSEPLRRSLAGNASRIHFVVYESI